MRSVAFDNVTPIRPLLEVVESRVADLDDGFTRIANELLEAVLEADFTARQLKIVLAVIRKTYGFGKKFDRIANTQIAQITGIHHTHVCKTKNELIDMGVLALEGRKIGINKTVSGWNFSGCRNSKALAKTANKCLAKSANEVKPTQLNTKETIQKKERNNKRLSSENSNELSDKLPKNSLPAVRPGSAIQSANGQKWGSEDDLRAAQWIFAKVQEVAPASSAPNWAAWANDIRLARTALNVSHREICEVFAWANADQFWQTNILSPAKLRQKWPTLTAQMAQPSRQRQQQHQHQQETTPHWNSAEAWEEFI